MLVLLLIGLAAGDPVRFFEEDFLHPKQRAMMARMPMPAGGMQETSRAAKEQGAILAEQLLAGSRSQANCLAKAFCQYGAGSLRGKPEDTPADEMDMDYVLNLIKDTFDGFMDYFPTKESGDTTKRIVGAFKVGESMGDEACKTLFECEENYSDNGMRQGRITCEGAGMICPGLSISCAMCGLYAPAVCGSACTVAGLYCGFGGYACAAAK